MYFSTKILGRPYPVFYDDDGNALLDSKLIDFLADRIEVEGTDAWFSLSEEDLLAGFTLPDSWKGKAIKKGADTLDVWIDSGCSHRAVLKRPKDFNGHLTFILRVVINTAVGFKVLFGQA